MAADPVVTWKAAVLAKGFKIQGDVRNGIQATVPYLIGWGNAYSFINDVINPVYVTKVGPITFRMPYRLPSSVVATPCYAQAFSIEPCAVDPSLGNVAVLPYHGLAAGEFFSHAIVTIEYRQLPFALDGEDPFGLNQLDPSNPIPYCEQSVKIGGQMVTRKGANYVYAGTSTPLAGDVGVLVPEAKLVLHFPHVPYLPWQYLVPYVGKVNQNAFLGCAAQTLLLEAPSTQAKQALAASQPVECDLSLEFAYNPLGWNNQPQANGTLAAVTLADGSGQGIYQTADFSQIIQTIAFANIGG